MTLRGLLIVALVVAGCRDEGAAPPDRAAMARQAIDEGQPKRALKSVSDAASGPELVARMQALIELDEWGAFERLLRSVPAGPEKDALSCLLASARRDVGAVRRCEHDHERTVLGPTLFDHTQRALGRALETERRRDEAELVLKELAQTHASAANRKAVVAFLERQGFVGQAVDYLDAWVAATPGDKSLELKLVQLLERKVRGDLLGRRADEAEAAARRILTLAPQRAQIRYFLADALEMKGDKTGAEAERATAKAAGASPPVPVDAMPSP